MPFALTFRVHGDEYQGRVKLHYDKCYQQEQILFG